MREIWKLIPRGRGFYKASNLGRIKSILTGRKRRYRIAERVMRPTAAGYGYRALCLSLDGEGAVSDYIHRFVWEAFRGPIPRGLEINHKNAVKSDNRIRNLELCTRKRNVSHARKLGLIKIMARGSANHSAKLDETRVAIIKARLRRGDSQRSMYRDFGVSLQTINNIARGTAWTHVKPSGLDALLEYEVAQHQRHEMGVSDA